jgi:hypothetical protein
MLVPVSQGTQNQPTREEITDAVSASPRNATPGREILGRAFFAIGLPRAWLGGERGVQLGEGFDRTDRRVPYTSHCTFSSPHAGSGGFQL